MKKLLIILLLASCQTQRYEYQLLADKKEKYYYTTNPQDLISIVINKEIIDDPAVCSYDKNKLPAKKEALKALDKLGADNVYVLGLSNSTGQLKDINGKFEFGYKKGQYCRVAIFTKDKNENK